MSHIFLYPGQLAATANPCIIRTILGSCVAVALWDKQTGVGGLCHYLLPDAPGTSGQSARYGEFAVRDLIQRCLKLGARQETLTARIYGGGSVVDSLASSQMSIGGKNIECARRILQVEKIAVAFESVGGNSGRRISLDTATGEVFEEIQGEHALTNRVGARVAKPLPLTKILVVDDSATIRNVLKNVFEKSKKVVVVGTAIDPYDAREKIIALKPDVITLDIEMPRMNGIAFLEKLMAHHPMPVVVVSSLSSQGTAAQRALDLGAIEFVHKPSQFDPMVLSELAEQLIPKVIAAASVSVKKTDASQKVFTPTAVSVRPSRSKASPISLVVIGGNGGAADALAKIIPALASDTPPVVVTVSTIAGFADAWAQKLKASAKLPVTVEVARETTSLRQGHVYIAAESHVKIMGDRDHPRLEPFKAAPASGQRPSSDILFSSAADACGSSVIAILLSGYGQDGVNGMSIVREKGGWTICQDPNDCAFNFNVVAALEEGVIDEVAPRHEVARRIYDRRSEIIV